MKRGVRVLGALTLLASILSIPSAFAATTYSFTNAGATGQNGPTQAQVTTAYTGTNLAGAVTVSTQGIQTWTVPVSGSYQINAVGAGGAGTAGGNGASMSGTFTLTSGTVLKIVVGQTGVTVTSGSSRFGGGGGSYVTNSSNSPYVVAGGGGGSAISGGGYTPPTATDGSTVANPGSTSGGAAGTGSSGCGGQGQGGGGLTGNGTGVPTAMSFTNASVGGGSGSDQCPASIGGTPFGGFGGGGAGGNGGGAGGGYYGGTGGDNTPINSQYDSGDGGGSYNNGTSQTNTVASNRGANGSVTITLLGPSLTTFAPTATITNSSSISYNIVFSQTVTGLATNDFSLSGTGSSTCVIGSPSGSGATYTIALSSCSPGTVILTMAANAVQNTDPQYAPSSNTAAPTVTIDQTPPTISTVTAPVNKTYIPAETPTFTVTYSESITVIGSPRLQLTVGALTKYANYISMSDSKTALFRYTVGTASGEFDTNGIDVNTTFDLNGGRIDDLAGNSLSLTTFTAPTLTSVFVAQKASAPTITSITPGSTQLTVNFNAGSSNGSSITNYKYSLNGGSFTAASPVDTQTPLVITGLTNGTGYTVRILAVTLAGDGDSSTAVTETPSAITVTGDSTIVLTYGTSGSTGNYSASGGTNVFTWSLGTAISGVSLSGTSVNVANTLNAGTYTQTVRATDGASAVGSKQLTITISKASSTMSLALQSGGNSTPVGQSPVITIATARAGTVVFSAGGQVISACASITIASTSGTCTLPAPGGTGSLSLDAVFTPTSGNYDSATASISITIVDGVSTVTLSLAGGTVIPPKGQVINIIAAVDQAGKLTILIDGKRLAGCFNKSASIGNVTCAWKPAVQKQVTITARLTPTNSVYNNSSSSLKVSVVRRSGTR